MQRTNSKTSKPKIEGGLRKKHVESFSSDEEFLQVVNEATETLYGLPTSEHHRRPKNTGKNMNRAREALDTRPKKSDQSHMRLKKVTVPVSKGTQSESSDEEITKPKHRKRNTDLWRNTLYYAKLHPDAIAPSKAQNNDAGYDIYSVVDIVIPANSYAKVETGICARIMPSPNAKAMLRQMGLMVHLRVSSRSGLAFKNGIEVGAGIIDPGYIGEIKVKLINNTSTDFTISKGDKIAQMIPYTFMIADIVESVSFDNITTARGDKGFGSSGNSIHDLKQPKDQQTEPQSADQSKDETNND